MVPTDFHGYFETSSAVAGTLIGLLFVSITLRYEAIFGTRSPTRNRSLAIGGFAALVNSLSVSVLSLIPHQNVGAAAAALGVIGASVTVRTQWRAHDWTDRRTVFAFSLVAYVSQVVVGVLLLVHPHDDGYVLWIAYLVVASFLSALIRSWQLLRSEVEAAGGELS